MNKELRGTLRLVARIFIIIEAVLMFYFIYPVILGIFAYRYVDLEGEENKNTKLIWAILTLILVSRVAGVLMLVDIFVPDQEEKPAEEKKEEKPAEVEKAEVEEVK